MSRDKNFLLHSLNEHKMRVYYFICIGFIIALVSKMMITIMQDSPTIPTIVLPKRVRTPCRIGVPKFIFMYWHQGSQEMPPFTKTIVKIWQNLNPDWTLHVLDQYNVNEWLTDKQNEFLAHHKIPKIAHKSDMIRSYILKNHGGVWADVTLLPLRPLSDWDFDLGEFSAYKFEDVNYKINEKNIGKRGKNGRPIVNFFLAAQKNSYYLCRLIEMLEIYITNTWSLFRPYFYWHHEFDQLILIDTKTKEWFLNEKTGISIHNKCNIIDNGDRYLKRFLSRTTNEDCAACVKLGLRDNRKRILSNKYLKGYYESIGFQMEFSINKT